MESWYIGVKLDDMEFPLHLDGAKTLLNVDAYEKEVKYDEYADIAFSLLLVSEGDKDALKKVAAYIQQQHRTIENLTKKYNTIRENLYQWLRWAQRWTQPKTKETKEECD